jgi:hypothetical protein
VSSLRPLATIALLAAVGVFLYMKINDSEPKLSPELETWSTSELDIGAPEGFAAGPGAAATSAPPRSGEAPPFSSAALNPAPATTPAPAAGDVAPAWTPGPLAVASPTSGPANDNVDSSPVARSADTPAMPEMPASPGAATTDPPAFDPKASPESDGMAGGLSPVTPADITTPPITKTSMFAAARVAVQGALDRGELANALLLLSDWYGDPSLTPAESQEVNDLLSQLAGSVIYEGPPAHRLLPAHIVQAGETLDSIAGKYQVPAQLLAKINGVSEAGALTSGQELKVMQGPFSALIDLSERKMTLMLERRYAGQFALEIDPAASVEEGQWKVDQKLLTPGGGGLYAAASGPAEDRSLLLANLADPAGNAAVLRGPGNADPIGAAPRGRVIRLKAGDVNDIYDILSVGSRVTIRR